MLGKLFGIFLIGATVATIFDILGGLITILIGIAISVYNIIISIWGAALILFIFALIEEVVGRIKI